MNKDQFWKIIDNINQSGPFADEDGYKECVLNTLFPCSFEDLLDWHHIMTLYEDALIQPPRGVLDICMGNFSSGSR